MQGSIKKSTFDYFMANSKYGDKIIFHSGKTYTFQHHTDMGRAVKAMQKAGLIEIFHKKIDEQKYGKKKFGIYDQIAVRISEQTRVTLDRFHFDGMDRNEVHNMIVNGITNE
tara:strand:+ start:267 stop:602 length:336 start_codon:yes stop_codon:yes gene_type:complete